MTAQTMLPVNDSLADRAYFEDGAFVTVETTDDGLFIGTLEPVGIVEGIASGIRLHTGLRGRPPIIAIEDIEDVQHVSNPFNTHIAKEAS